MRLLNGLLIAVLWTVPVYAQENLPFSKGETLLYTIKKLGVGGKASLTFEGEQKTDGKETYLIVFKADGFNFYDEERIFVDRQTFSPVSVVRDLNIFGKKEKITEDYIPSKGVKITKVAGGKTTTQMIEKSGPIDNIYGVIYRYRATGSFKIGDQLDLHLPTMDVKLKLAKMDKITAAGKKNDAFFMESVPNKYMVWFDTSDRKIPLRITGTAGLGNTTMTLTHSDPPRENER